MSVLFVCCFLYDAGYEYTDYLSLVVFLKNEINETEYN